VTGTRPALVLDFGGPVLITPFELTGRAERRLGLPPGSLPWRGPFEPGADPQWRAVLDGTLHERDYWARRAAEFAALTGRPGGTRELITALYAEQPEDVLVRDGALALMSDARGAGLPVGILTNDLGAFHSPRWVHALRVLDLADAMVDGSHVGILKPDPRVYHMIADQLGVPVTDAVFLDDQPVNLAGASAVGMTAVRVDVTRPDEAFGRTRALLGLSAS
jgi:putative hydrolase of the HAD superfamily